MGRERREVRGVREKEVAGRVRKRRGKTWARVRVTEKV